MGTGATEIGGCSNMAATDQEGTGSAYLAME